MDGKGILFKDFIKGDDLRFFIPVYQRNYDWKRVNCKKLFDDLISLVEKQNKSTHFFGSIVYYKKTKYDNNYYIIDGQQRITTISILVLAIINSIKNGKIKCDDSEWLIKRMETFLYASLTREDRKQKLTPIKKDLNAYDALFTNDEKKFVNQSNITNNYLLFCNLLENSSISPMQIFDAIERLEIIYIYVEEHDDPQEVFESLNSTGVKLTSADKIRNFLLMTLTSSDQEYYYQNYWSELERLINEIRKSFDEENNDKSLYKDATMFIRDYLTIKNSKISNIDDVYEDFKEYAKSRDRKILFDDLLKYARYYENFLTASIKDKPFINKKLRQINTLKSSVTMPFFLSFMDYAIENKLDDKEILDVIDTVENYLARRIICNLPTNALNKIFAALHNDILKNINDYAKANKQLNSNYSDILKYILLQKKDNTKFPKDSEVAENFKTRRIYKLPPDQKFFFFERMENGNGKEGNANIVEQMKSDVNPLTIEHIMPQTLNADWQEMLGSDYENIHEEYLHTFANLTLTGYNSDYSNRKFSEKLNGYVDEQSGNIIAGLKESKFYLTESVKCCSKWGKEELDNRCSVLTKRFLSIWAFPKSDFIPLSKEDVLSLEDDDSEFTGKKIISFVYKGRNYPLNKEEWKTAELEICKLVYEENKNQIYELCKTNSSFDNIYRKGFTKIADDCYVWTDCSTSSKICVLKKLFEFCEIDFSLLQFTIKLDN